MILLSINRNSRSPVYQQIIDGIIGLIENETIKPGYRLPATRQLCNKLGTDRTTVYRAYQHLLSLGYLESRPGSYTTVRKRVKVNALQSPPRPAIISWEKAMNRSAKGMYDFLLEHDKPGSSPSSADLIDFTHLAVDKRLYPVDDFRKCMNEVLNYQGRELLGYGKVAGFFPLREYLANRLRTHGISVVSKNILITNGCQQALELIIKLLVSPGMGVVIEAPTYIDLIPLLKYYQAKVIEVPVLRDGLDLDLLERILKKVKPALIYTIPNFHNPTGITTSQSHRERLLAIAEQFKVPIVEDGFEEEMKYFGKIVLPIKSMDRNQIVIYLGTFSKTLFAGLRLGWLVADEELIKRLTAIKKFCDLGVNTISQAAMNVFCRNGYFDLHIRRIQRAFRKRMTAALRTISKEFPKSVSWTRPDGGYTIWISLNDRYCQEESINEILIKHRVMALPGNLFFFTPSKESHFRISISALDEMEIVAGIERIGTALKEVKK